MNDTDRTKINVLRLQTSNLLWKISFVSTEGEPDGVLISVYDVVGGRLISGFDVDAEPDEDDMIEPVAVYPLDLNEACLLWTAISLVALRNEKALFEPRVEETPLEPRTTGRPSYEGW